MIDTKFDLVAADLSTADTSIIVDLALEGAVPRPIRRAKIVCTIGPASNTEGAMRDLMRLGMDVARLNFSHGTHAQHARHIARLRRVARREERTICVLGDLQGPKIRTGRLKGHAPIRLTTGSRIRLTPREVAGTEEVISTSFPGLTGEVEPGSKILLSDGLIELRVSRIQGDDVECEVITGGLLGEQQGMNLPGALVSLPSLTDKDRADLQFGIKHGVDLVALSFVRSAADVHALKDLIRDLGGDAQVVAKLEKPQAIDDLDEILEAADAVMLARGDLGVELPPEKVPVIQKQVIRRAGEFRKPVITATQMLESMIENGSPTRAEASDVANAIFDGSDAVMLSAETATGKYSREAVAIMSRIIVEAERSPEPSDSRRRGQHRRLSIAETICESIAHAADDLDMAAIAVFTESGNTARQISKYRAKSEIFAFSQSQPVANRMNLLWGVQPVFHAAARSAEHMVAIAERELLGRAKIKAGDVVGVVAGTRLASGSTNFIRLHVVEDNRAETTARRKSKTR
ncbi:MAG: pyruvate kinase [Acidobacteria bacterium]|nr:pyruvate kinase [Acidobacteriota bacterium]